MIREFFLTADEREAWRRYLPERRSVFGSLGYARICQVFRGVSARLYVVETGDAAILYPLLLRSLTNLPFRVETRAQWDALTPEFTGPILCGNGAEVTAAFPKFRDAFFAKAGIVAEFAHLHPWSKSLALLEPGCEYNRDIIWVDTTLNPEDLWRDHVRKQCRQQIRQAEREGVTTVVASCDEHVREFHRLYSHTMARNDAEAGYHFSYEFFRAFREELPQNSMFLLAAYREQFVGGCLCLYDDDDAFYFLAGSDAAFQQVRPGNAVVWELIRWAHSTGKKRLILGGGYRAEDGVFHFKSNFSRLRQPFNIYKHVHLQQDYASLERGFREYKGLTSERIDYFPIYRHRPPVVEIAPGEREVAHGRLTIKQEKDVPMAASTQAFAPWPQFAEDEVEAAAAVLRSGRVNYWTGDEGRLFEREFAEFTQCQHAVAVANGTVALELALRALGIGPGDDVVTTSRTFIATVSAVVAVGARPVFADVDRDTQNITAETIRAALTPATRAIIAVHLAGWPCEMDEILNVAAQFGLRVIEDCAQAHGATHRGRPVGSFGDIGAFSFCQDKNMTTAGEGGMVTTNSERLWLRMWSYKDHGKSYEKACRQVHPPGFRWWHESFGTNWRLSEVQSAVGRVALRKLPEWNAIRQRHADILTDRLSRLTCLRVPSPPNHVGHAYYKFYAFVVPEELAEGWDRDRIAQTIAARGVPCTTGSCSEVYLEEAFPPRWRPTRRLPVARELGESSLMFLVHPTLTEANMARTCEVTEQVMLQATRARVPLEMAAGGQ